LATGAGKPTVRKAQFPSGQRMAKKRTPVRRKATGNRGTMAGPPPAVPDNCPDTGSCPDPKGC